MTIEQKLCGYCNRVYAKEEDFLQLTSQWRLCSSGNLWFNCNCGSTLMLPKGKFSWYSPDLSMSKEASSLFNNIATMEELPHIPSAVMELQQLLASPDAEIHQLASAVKKDPFIASEVIAMADNLRSIRDQGGKRTQVSLEYIISFIGKKQLSSLVAVASMGSFKFKTQNFDRKIFWNDAYLTAAISELLWKKFFSEKEVDRAYLSGCLCNIGKLVLAIIYPVELDKLWVEMKNPNFQSTWEVAEARNNLPSHCLLGEIGAVFWGFPSFVIEVVKNHHDPMSDGSLKDPDLCNLVTLANMYAHWVKLEPHRIDESKMYKIAQYFDLKKKDVDGIAEEIRKVLPSSLLK